MLPCPSCQASNEAAAALCTDCGAQLAASKLEASMLRPRLRAFPLLLTILVCGAAGLGAASFAFRSEPVSYEAEVEVAASEVLPYPTAPERTFALANETMNLPEGGSRSYALASGTHIIRVRSEPHGLTLALDAHAECTRPLAVAARTWFETRCTLRTRASLIVSNPAAAGEGSSELASISVATVME